MMGENARNACTASVQLTAEGKTMKTDMEFVRQAQTAPQKQTK